MMLNDAGASLLQLHPIAGSVWERDLYIHEPGPDGAFVEVGPMLPQSAIPPTPTGGGIQGGDGGRLNFVAANPALLTHTVRAGSNKQQTSARGHKRTLAR